MGKLPEEYIENMKELLGSESEKYFASFSSSSKRGLRVNTNYISVEKFQNIFNYPISSIDEKNAIFNLETSEKIGNSVFHHAGIIYLQEPSSMLPAIALDVKDGEKVLDLCSAPGGKAGQILNVNKNGIVVLNEIVKSRANVLFSNIERQGYKNCLITSLEPEKLAENLPNYFDKILVDAPCSGEGMFRREPETILEWNNSLPKFNHERQMQILEQADKMLKQNGELVYSTCTFNLEENEKTVLEFAKNFGYEILELNNFIKDKTTAGFDIGKNTSFCRRCFPQNDFGEGQFISKLVKKSVNNNDFYRNKKQYDCLTRNEQQIVDEFIDNTVKKRNFKFVKIKNQIYIAENDFPYIKDGVVNIGIRVGEIEKNRIVPHHQFFKCYGNEFERKIELKLDDERIKQYLYGLEIETDLQNGFASVVFEGAVLGGGKVVNGKLKNYYPKGLRLLKI